MTLRFICQRIAWWFRMYHFGDKFKTQREQLDYKILGELSNTYRAEDLTLYKPRIGVGITLNVWHSNAGRLVDFIDVLYKSISLDKEINISDYTKSSKRNTMTLDDWLIDDEGCDIDIQKLWQEVSSTAQAIYLLMVELDTDNHVRNLYYNRKMMVLFQDVLTIMEGLERVVTLRYDR